MLLNGEAGLVELVVLSDAVLVEFVVLPDAAPVEFASGPVKKKLPATGLPSPVCSANAEILKLLMDVEALTKALTIALKFDGCTNSRSVYLQSPEKAASLSCARAMWQKQPTCGDQTLREA